MRKSNTQLALRSPEAGSPPAPPKIVYKAAPHETQYVIHQTVLGEFALCWSAHWLEGFFCISDFPAEVVQYVHNVVLGPQRDGRWPDHDDEKPFTDSLDQLARSGGPFAAIATALLRGHSAMNAKALPTRAESTC